MERYFCHTAWTSFNKYGLLSLKFLFWSKLECNSVTKPNTGPPQRHKIGGIKKYILNHEQKLTAVADSCPWYLNPSNVITYLNTHLFNISMWACLHCTHICSWMSTEVKGRNPGSAEFKVVTDRNKTNAPQNCTEQPNDSLNIEAEVQNFICKEAINRFWTSIISLQEIQNILLHNLWFCNVLKVNRCQIMAHL